MKYLIITLIIIMGGEWTVRSCYSAGGDPEMDHFSETVICHFD